jgi:SAM-dependent methyltransferase
LPDFSQRANLAEYPELMDQPCSYEELRDCLRSIASVNRLTRAYHPTLHWLNHVYGVLPLQTKPVHIVDIGCGYGDMLRRVYDWAEEKHLPVTLTGIDISTDAIRAAREATIPGTITFLYGSAYEFTPPQTIDLVISSLLMHHLPNAEIVEMLNWMESVARMGWFINDLHRMAMPYRAFRLLSRFTSWHPFVKHDGPVSILRSFREDDWRLLCRAAAIPADEYIVREYWPARLCVARLHMKGIKVR